MSSLAYADPAIEIPAYIHWPQPEKPQRPITLWVSLGVAAVVSLFSGVAVANAWSHMPDYDPNNNITNYVAVSDDAPAPSSNLVAFTPPPDYNTREAPVIPAVYDEPVQPSMAVQMKGEAQFDQADLAVAMGDDQNEHPASCVGACTQATPAATPTESGTGYDMPEAPIPYESMTPVSVDRNIPK